MFMDPSTSNSIPPFVTKQEESSDDDESFTVPNVETAANRDEGKRHGNYSSGGGQEEGSAAAPKSRRAKNPADREHRRLKSVNRLLRNRVSAQQARERKKVYTCELEFRANELYDKNSQLEERISTLINENTMLRKVLMNTRPKADSSFDKRNDDSGTS